MAAQDKPVRAQPLWVKWIRALISIVLVATAVGFVMRHAARALERNQRPAGFYRGVLQGALMPCALPNLLVGKDVSIYNENNTGVKYKLGYTCGVNACGALFFGFMFFRVNRWRKK